MKFTGLILICAAGSLALILPAAGVVKFPMRTGSTQSAAMENSAVAVPAALQSGFLPSASLPALTQPNARPLGGTPSLGETLNLGERTLSSDPIDPWNKQSLCMGFWLLLGPVALLGLALWTFSPGPKPNAV